MEGMRLHYRLAVVELHTFHPKQKAFAPPLKGTPISQSHAKNVVALSHTAVLNQVAGGHLI